MKTIEKYFQDLSDLQRKQLTDLEDLYKFWNEQINVISRKDTENFYERHVLHSMGIAKIIAFKDGTTILDIGTGGGFPGIPLAILFPNCHFTLIDSVGKKIKVVNEVAESLGLTNVTGIHGRAESLKEKFDFVVSRAVTAMPAFLYWTRGKFNKKSNNTLPNGILYLKGGDLKEELKSLKQKHKVIPLNKYFNEEFFETKKLVYVSGN